MGEVAKSVARFVSTSFGQVALTAFYVGLVVGGAAGLTTAAFVIAQIR